jgi:hypothetical protein
MSEPGQLRIDFDYDDRTAKLATEFAIIIAPHLPPGTKKELVVSLSTRMARLAGERYAHFGEPVDPIRCHTCDEMTLPKTRVRVPVCPRCSLEGRSLGARG